MNFDKPDRIVLRACALALCAFLIVEAHAAVDCEQMTNPFHPCHRQADQGAGGMPQAAKAPGISNNPGGLSGGGQVGGKSPGKGGHKGHHGKHGGKSHGK